MSAGRPRHRRTSPAQRLGGAVEDVRRDASEAAGLERMTLAAPVARRTTDGTFGGTTAAAITSMAVTVDAEEDDRFVIIGEADLVNDAASGIGELQARVGGSTVLRTASAEVFLSAFVTVHVWTDYTATADGSLTFALYRRSADGAKQVRLDADAERPALLAVYRLGIPADDGS